jgi:hypothetical protein
MCGQERLPAGGVALVLALHGPPTAGIDRGVPLLVALEPGQVGQLPREGEEQRRGVAAVRQRGLKG